MPSFKNVSGEKTLVSQSYLIIKLHEQSGTCLVKYKWESEASVTKESKQVILTTDEKVCRLD